MSTAPHSLPPASTTPSVSTTSSPAPHSHAPDSPPGLPNPLQELEAHLAREIARKERWGTLDMDDSPEAAVIAPAFPRLWEALEHLQRELATPWRNADRQAIRHQARHQMVARVSITAGVAAIILAVVQLALKYSRPEWSVVAQAWEALAVGAAVAAVAGGIWAKFDRDWLGQRHRAERLRMLKFRSLGRAELFRGDLAAWKQWPAAELRALEDCDHFERVKEWSRLGDAEPPDPAAPGCAAAPEFVQALIVYYRYKRLEFQADYFGRRSRKIAKQTAPFRHVTVSLFFVSVIAALVHFAVELALGRTAHSGPGETQSEGLWTHIGIWAVALAAIAPVVGIGFRAWFAAFELPRSASLYTAKRLGLLRASEQMREDAAAPAASQRHIAQDENLLEQEHREWLRLLLDAEWFL